ncbi:MAG: VOC family protein, partial [Thermoanaerobaculia bacterium]
MSAPQARILAVHPVLMARDVEASLRFFAGLGFAERFRDRERAPLYAVVGRDGCEVHLQWNDAANDDSGRDRPTYRFLVFDVDRLFVEFSASGIAPDRSVPGSPWLRPAETPWGTREFHLRDPAGNGLQFYTPSARHPNTDRGALEIR